MTLATHEEVVDAEIVLTKMEALQLVEELRQLATTYAKTKAAIREKLDYARSTNAWEQIEGCNSYGDFIAHTFSGIPIKWDRDDRRELAEDMAFHEDGGMSTRQIGTALGVDKRTVGRDLSGAFAPDEPRKVQSSDGITRTYRTKPKDEWPVVPPAEPEEREMTATLAHRTPFEVGQKLEYRKRSYAVVGEDGRLQFTGNAAEIAEIIRSDESMHSSGELKREHGFSQNTASKVLGLLRDNGEIPDAAPNRLVGRFDSIAQGLTYIADDLEKQMDDLKRSDADDLEYGREFFEEAMTKLNAFRRELNKKFK